MTKEEIESDKKNIDHPKRYFGGTEYECYKVLEKWVSSEEYIGWLRCSAIKYLCRLGKKDEMAQELRKAAWYASRAADFIDSHSEEFS